MSAKRSERPRTKFSLRLQVLLYFAVFFIGTSVAVYTVLVSAAKEQVNVLIQSDLEHVLETAAAGVDAEKLLSLAENGQPNQEGFSDDPRYLALLAWLDAVHQTEPDAWPYLYVPAEDPNEIYFVVDLISIYEPETAAGFMELYRSNSGFILLGLEKKTFRQVDRALIRNIREIGDQVKGHLLSQYFHRTAERLSGIFPPREIGIYQDKFGAWASGYMPVRNAAGEPVAGIGVDFKADVLHSKYQQGQRIILRMMLITSVIPFIFLVSFLRRLVVPLDELTTIAGNIQKDIPFTEKNFRNIQKSLTADEIDILAEVLEGMVEQIRQRERRYYAVIEAQDALILRTSPDGQFTFSNQAYDDLRGNPEVNTLAEVTGDGIHLEDQQQSLDFLAQELPKITLDDPVRKHEMRIYDHDGRVKWYQWTITGIFNDRGELTEYQGVGQDITELKDIQAELEKTNNHLREISHDLLNATEQERSKIAREVHDDMLNYISELVLGLEDDVSAREVNHTYQMIADRLRETVYNLRPPMLAYGLAYGLKDYVYTLNERLEGSPQVRLDLTAECTGYPKEVDIHLFRIVQQACENAVEHACPKKIMVTGELRPDQIRLAVEDDGSGFNWNRAAFIDDSIGQNRFGLAGMLERSLIVGADVDISSEEGAGTQVEITWRQEDYQQLAMSSVRSDLPNRL
jgi:PAS domain S-box-containing protein